MSMAVCLQSMFNIQVCVTRDECMHKGSFTPDPDHAQHGMVR